MDKKLMDALLSPAPYPDSPASITLIQTHISYLFLTDRYVYKIKKPVDFGFLDFTTLEKRHFYCNEEVRLNRRLSPDIYLGVDELRLDRAGNFSLNGEGETVEYAVKMLRLPQERIMARLLEEGKVTADDIIALARLVARFHAAAVRSREIDEFGSEKTILANWEENLRQTAPYVGRTLSAEAFELIGSWARQRIRQNSEIIKERVAQGYIREGDGDLHSENICLDKSIHIFDCIEFNEKFRYGDTAADVAFLAMDLENHGRRDLAQLFVTAYSETSGDRGLSAIVPLYLANRAFIRGKVESFRLDDPGIPHEEKLAAADRARRFFRLCRGYILRQNLPLSLIITCAPTGSGKSSLAAELSFQLGIDHFATDRERKRLAGLAPHERSRDIYSPEWTQKTYDCLLSTARETLLRGESVILDGTFLKKIYRSAFSELAQSVGSRMIILDLHCQANTIRERLNARSRDPYAVSDGTWEIYQQQIAAMEAPDSSEGELISLDAAVAPAVMAELVIDQLGLFHH